jgi:hypothetical protein
MNGKVEVRLSSNDEVSHHYINSGWMKKKKQAFGPGELKPKK